MVFDCGILVNTQPVSWMSFFLLFATGAGLVYYYDREKKRHIEGTLLMVSLLLFFFEDIIKCNENLIM